MLYSSDNKKWKNFPIKLVIISGKLSHIKVIRKKWKIAP